MRKVTLSMLCGACAMLAMMVFPNSSSAANSEERALPASPCASQVYMSASGGGARLIFYSPINVTSSVTYTVTATGVTVNSTSDRITATPHRMDARPEMFECYLPSLSSGHTDVIVTISVQGVSGYTDVKGQWVVNSLNPGGHWTLY